jgi:uncharacterized protein
MNEFENGLEKRWKFDFNAPCDSEIDLEKLKEFILQDNEPVIIFYGGEPLLKLDKIKKIMDVFGDSVRYCMQTNGRLLDMVPSEYMDKFSRILVSIDGDRERTNYNRGAGTYDLILENIKFVRENGYKGEIVARMTISFSDLFEQVKHLTEIKEFDSVHWQIDAGFYKSDFIEKEFKEFVDEYNESVSKLMKYWIDNIKKGKVLKLYPFLGIFESFYHGRSTKLRCGSGHSGYTITTKGDIVACPILNNVTDFYTGTLDSKLDELKKFDVGEPCTKCMYKRICGGRCLYSNQAKLWPEKGMKLICETIIHLINVMKKHMKEIRELIDKKIINEKDFEYEKYFGPEIIP